MSGRLREERTSFCVISVNDHTALPEFSCSSGFRTPLNWRLTLAVLYLLVSRGASSTLQHGVRTGYGFRSSCLLLGVKKGLRAKVKVIVSFR